jgi:hypothetical protein
VLTGPTTPDAVTDFIEALVDAIDDMDFEADASTHVNGDQLTVTVEVVVRVDDPFDAQAKGLDAIRHGLAAAGVRGHDDLMDSLDSSTRVLLPA